MIEILHFGLSSHQGGIESYLERIYSHIDKSKFHFNFIDMTGLNDKPCYYDLFKKDCTFYKVTPRRVSFFKNKADIRNLFKNHKFDILHFHGNTLSYALPIYVALKNDCKVIVHSTSSGVKMGMVSCIFHYLNKFRILHKNVMHVAVSQFAANWMFNGKNCTIINNSIDSKRFEFHDEIRDKIRCREDVKEKFVVGHIGNFGEEKNPYFVIDIFESIFERNKNSFLWLVGSGSNEGKIKQYVYEKKLCDFVKFFGTRNDVQDLLSGMDCFLFPSLREGFPTVVVEAQCNGLPCFISDNITSEVVLTDLIEKISLLESCDKWAEQITRKNYSQNRGNSYKKIIERRHSIERGIKIIEAMYIELSQK